MCMHNLNPRRFTIVRSRESLLSVFAVAGGIAVMFAVDSVRVENKPVVVSMQLNFLAPTDPIRSPMFLVENLSAFFDLYRRHALPIFLAALYMLRRLRHA